VKSNPGNNQKKIGK